MGNYSVQTCKRCVNIGRPTGTWAKCLECQSWYCLFCDIMVLKYFPRKTIDEPNSCICRQCVCKLSIFCVECRTKITQNGCATQCTLCEDWFCGKAACKSKIYYFRESGERIPKCDRCIMWREGDSDWDYQSE